MSLFISASEKQRRGAESQIMLMTVNMSGKGDPEFPAELSGPSWLFLQQSRDGGWEGTVSNEARSVLFLVGNDNFQPGTSDLLI